MINKDRLISRFMHIVEIDSVSGQEGRMRDYLISEFSQRGYEVKEDNAGEILGTESGNLLVKIPGTVEAQPLMLCGHMDTVEPGKGIKALIDGDIIKSQGNTILASDDKGAIACILEAVDVINENEIPHPPLELLFTVCEEQGLQGAKLFDYSGIKSQIAYALDASGDPGVIIVQGPCQNEIEYMVYGKTAHAGMNPEDGINAIQAMARALTKMPCGRIDRETTCNFGIIDGGTARNIVADYCHVKGEARSQTRKGLDEITEQLQAAFKAEVEAVGGRPEVVVKFLYPELKLNPGDRVVELAVKAAESIGLKPQLGSTGGGSDASIINNAGITCANLGIGMTAAHTCDEYIKIDHLIKDAELVMALIKVAAMGI